MEYEYLLDVKEILGLTMKSVVQQGNNSIVFTAEDNTVYSLEHIQDCCEAVTIEDVVGDLQDLVGSPILLAEEVTNRDDPKEGYVESFTWTFYKFATLKGYVDIRWYGKSNGYYSEAVDFIKYQRNKYE